MPSKLANVFSLLKGTQDEKHSFFDLKNDKLC